MNYNEMIQWLINIDNQHTSDPDILRRASIIKDDILDFEYKVFNNILNSIKSEKSQLAFIEEQKSQRDSSDLYKSYCDSEIARHKEILKNYENQVNSLYSKENIIGFYEKRKKACEARIQYANNQLAVNSEDRVARISLNDSQREMSDIEFSLNILNGNDVDLLIDVSKDGRKI